MFCTRKVLFYCNETILLDTAPEAPDPADGGVIDCHPDLPSPQHVEAGQVGRCIPFLLGKSELFKNVKVDREGEAFRRHGFSGQRRLQRRSAGQSGARVRAQREWISEFSRRRNGS